MKIVIEIPEDVLKRTVFYREFRDLNDCITTIKALEKAMPLPEGHGRLIDADDIMNDIKNDINEMTNIGIGVDGQYLWGKLNDAIYNAPTIIEGSDSE